MNESARHSELQKEINQVLEKISQAIENFNDVEVCAQYRRIEKLTEDNALEPIDYSEYIRWGSALYNLGKYEEANEKYKNAEENYLSTVSNTKHYDVSGGKVEIYFHWANVLSAWKHYKEANEKYEIASKIAHYDSALYQAWGDSYLNQKKYEMACQQYQRASDICSESHQREVACKEAKKAYEDAKQEKQKIHKKYRNQTKERQSLEENYKTKKNIFNRSANQYREERRLYGLEKEIYEAAREQHNTPISQLAAAEQQYQAATTENDTANKQFKDAEKRLAKKNNEIAEKFSVAKTAFERANRHYEIAKREYQKAESANAIANKHEVKGKKSTTRKFQTASKRFEAATRQFEIAHTQYQNAQEKRSSAQAEKNLERSLYDKAKTAHSEAKQAYQKATEQYKTSRQLYQAAQTQYEKIEQKYRTESKKYESIEKKYQTQKRNYDSAEYELARHRAKSKKIDTQIAEINIIFLTAKENYELRKKEKEEKSGYFGQAEEPILYGNWGVTLYLKQEYTKAFEKFETSIEKYAETLKKKSEDNSVTFTFSFSNIALLHMELHNYPKAWESWERARSKYAEAREDRRVVKTPAFLTTYANMEKEFFGDVKTANRLLQSSLKKDPDNIDTLLTLVDLYSQLREYLMNQHGHFSEPESLRQKGYNHLKRHSKNSVERAQNINSTPEAVAYREMRKYYRHAKQLLDKQRKDNDRRKELASQEGIDTSQWDNTQILTQLGSLALSIDENEEAKEYFSQALQLDPESSNIHEKLGVVYTRLAVTSDAGYKKAAKHFKASLSRDANDLNVWSNLAETYVKLKQLQKAEAEYQKILPIAPGHVESLIGLGEVHITRGDNGEVENYEQAVHYFDRAIDLAQEEMGSTLLKQGKVRAEVLYLRAYARTKIYEDNGKQKLLDLAKKDLTNCRKADPSNLKAKRALKKLPGTLISSSKWFVELAGPGIIFISAFLILLVSQHRFMGSPPHPSSLIAWLINASDESADGADNSEGPPPELIETERIEIIETGSESDSESIENEAAPTDAAASESARIRSTTTTTYVQVPADENNSSNEEKNDTSEHLLQQTAFTLGLLGIMAVALYLPQLVKLKVAGIELEKGSTNQIQTSRSLGLKR